MTTLVKKIQSVPSEMKAIKARRRCNREALEYLRREIADATK